MFDLPSGREVVIVNKSKEEEKAKQGLFFKNDEAKLVACETKNLESTTKCIKNVVSKSNSEANCVIIKIALVTKVSFILSDMSCAFNCQIDLFFFSFIFFSFVVF